METVWLLKELSDVNGTAFVVAAYSTKAMAVEAQKKREEQLAQRNPLGTCGYRVQEVRVLS